MRPRLLAIFCLAVGISAPASEPSDILRYVPRQAEFVVVVDRPIHLVNSAMGFEPLRQLMAFDAVKEEFESTNSRRFLQLVAHFEKTLTRRWPQLIDDLSGSGVALAMRFDSDPPPAMVVMKAKDQSLLHRAFEMSVEVAKSELERTESTDKVQTQTYRGYTKYQFGKDAFAAVAGPVLFLSNKSEAVDLGIDLYINGAGESLAKNGKTDSARASLPGQPLAWTYLDLDRIHGTSEAIEAYRYPRGDPGALALFQGMTDVIGKSPYVAFGHYANAESVRTAIRMAAGREATPAGLGLHLPPDGMAGSLPLLQPKNLLFSTSYYIDLGRLWTERERLLDEEARKELEGAEKRIGRFLGGRKLSEMLTSVGTYHRIVIVSREKAGYTVQPANLQPAGAFVTNMRDPKFADGMNAILRAVALFAGTQVKLKMTEEKIGPVKLVSYRFPENGKFEADVGNERFNVSPCFARIGDQFMVASTVELGRELVELLSRPESNDPKAGSKSTMRILVDSAGGAEALKAMEDTIITETILDRAISVERANKETKEFIDWLRKLGKLDFEINYGQGDFKYDITLRRKTKNTE